MTSTGCGNRGPSAPITASRAWCSTIWATGCTSSTWAWTSGGPRSSVTGKSTAVSSRSSYPGMRSPTWLRSGTSFLSHCCFPRCREHLAPGIRVLAGSVPAAPTDAGSARTGQGRYRRGPAGPSGRSAPAVPLDPAVRSGSRPPEASGLPGVDRGLAGWRHGAPQAHGSQSVASSQQVLRSSQREAPRNSPQRCRSRPLPSPCSSRLRACTRRRTEWRRTAPGCPLLLACRPAGRRWLADRRGPRSRRGVACRRSPPGRSAHLVKVRRELRGFSGCRDRPQRGRQRALPRRPLRRRNFLAGRNCPWRNCRRHSSLWHGSPWHSRRPHSNFRFLPHRRARAPRRPPPGRGPRRSQQAHRHRRQPPWPHGTALRPQAATARGTTSLLPTHSRAERRPAGTRSTG